MPPSDFNPYPPKGRDTPMPDPTKEEQAKARAAAEASAAATPAPRPAAMTEARPAPARPDFAAPVPADATPALVETLKNLEARSRPAGYASATPGLDEAGEKGPVYRVRGRLVNAHDREVNEDGSLVHPEQQQVDVYGRLT
jgi:hypothetical protein